MENQEKNNVYPITPGIEAKELPVDEIIITEGGAKDGKTTTTDPKTGETKVVFHKKTA
ncbi:MAG: hypothetical protein AAB819_00305 [Patescibacteria group bacterium]